MLSSFTFAQISTDHVVTDEISGFNWTTYVDNPDFSIEYKRTDCAVNSGLDKQYFLIKITNKTQSEISLNWEMELFYNGACKTCGIDEYKWGYSVGPLASVEGDCAVGAENKLRLFSKFIDANYSSDAELTGFKFSNLQHD
jgi:hypothetical protein